VSTSLSDTRSGELYRRALEVLPGGVNSPVRAMRAIGRDPIFIARGEGAELLDVDGNRFLDYVCSWGPLIHGHAHPRILAAVGEAASRGTSFGAPTAGEVELAVEVARRMDGVDMLRMTSSGTEATMTAIRLARAATGRERVLKFAGAYHGHLDGLLAQAGSGLATQALPGSPGVPASATASTVVVAWNDPQALAEAVERHEFAAILAEPMPANMGLVAPREGFLELLRRHAGENGALLVLDEVISGFRVAAGGAQELTGVSGDLTIMGKILGGGLPAAALGGRAELMRMLAPSGEVYQAGTLSGNPLAVAAGLATLEMLDETAYLRLGSLTTRLAEGLREAAAASDYPVEVSSAPGLLTVFFNDRPVMSFEDAQACDLDAYALWCRELLSRGVYPPPSQFEAWFPSLAHTPEQIERTIEAAGAAFAALRDPREAP
jgi:glutamate-1-semialdehyde 2,1-aminomutase